MISTGCIHTGQTRSIQEATIMQADADKVSSTVGWSTYEYSTTGQKMVDLGKQKDHISSGMEGD